MSQYSEDILVEQPTIALFASLGWQAANLFHEVHGDAGPTGRKSENDVLLPRHLKAALKKLNPTLPNVALDQAIEELGRDRSSMSLERANQEVYTLLKDGVRVQVTIDDEDTLETVKLIDWNNPSNNDFYLASQFWVAGDLGRKRADLVGFVNGIPLVLVELKASHKRVENAYRINLSDYKTTIPQLFWFNSVIILSNGSVSRIGSVTSDWEHFAEWKKVSSEGEKGRISLETLVKATCTPDRLLDITENFTLFSEEKAGLIKIIAKNHQYLGVNNAIEAVRNAKENNGRLGVFWHTQGSGKSYSMVFFSQKILRKFRGNWTFLVVTDRIELDDQIYRTFAATGAVTKDNTQAESAEDLKKLLREDNRYIFTLIQKFRTERGERYPVLSERSDIIVMTDEAHRSQYDVFALNMRNALPKASFIGFTGTPLMAGEERTREVFGDYVSIYNFAQAIEDGATVPLYYENRIPELQLTNDQLNEDMQGLLEQAELDEAQEQKLEREFSREYHLITREERLEKVAEDIVAHFMGRGHFGKAMVVSIDKATAVRMYDKVKKHWQRYLDDLQVKHRRARGEEREGLASTIRFMKDMDMAVVLSQSQNEVEEFANKGLDITLHRKRFVSERLDDKFKNPQDPLRIVFVCAMWMTGFDVPSCSTIYLDKPMKNHTLMQTIARANRVWKDKQNGLIVDYVGVFRNLQQALAIYGTAEGGAAEGEMPVKDKEALVGALDAATNDALFFLNQQGIDFGAMLQAEGFDFIGLRDDAVEKLVNPEEIKRKFLGLAKNVDNLYKAILPDDSASTYGPTRAVLNNIRDRIGNLSPEVSIDEVMQEVADLLDSSIAAEGYVIKESIEDTAHLIDLAQIDFDKLKERFAKGRKHTEVERLKGAIQKKLSEMVKLNKSRIDYLQKFQEMIEEYNRGSKNVEDMFAQLIAFTQDLTEEEQRHIAEELSEEELAVFDLLRRPDVELSPKEEKEVKRIAHDLMETLKRERLVLDWRKRQQTRAAVKVCIEDHLDKLPETYNREVWESTVEAVYQHVYDSYQGQGRSVYA